MDVKRFGELVGTSVATGVAVTPEQVTRVLTNEELLKAVRARNLVGGVAATSAVAEVVEAPDSPEQTLLSPESLLEGFDQAYQTYSFLLNAVNGDRAEVKGYNKPDQLPVIPADTIRADVEALLANEAVVAELQAGLDYFTANPEVTSPAPGFDLVIVPESLTVHDERTIAKDLQGKIPSDYDQPYIRPAAYNDGRTPEVTGKGYRLAFAPRHYNVPSGTAKHQTNWMNGNNRRNTATELQTATDAEAMAYINGLVDTEQLNNPATRFDQTYFRRFDQAPRDDAVSNVLVDPYGKLLLIESDVHFDLSARALVVPKA